MEGSGEDSWVIVRAVFDKAGGGRHVDKKGDDRVTYVDQRCRYDHTSGTCFVRGGTSMTNCFAESYASVEAARVGSAESLCFSALR